MRFSEFGCIESFKILRSFFELFPNATSFIWFKREKTTEPSEFRLLFSINRAVLFTRNLNSLRDRTVFLVGVTEHDSEIRNQKKLEPSLINPDESHKHAKYEKPTYDSTKASNPQRRQPQTESQKRRINIPPNTGTEGHIVMPKNINIILHSPSVFQNRINLESSDSTPIDFFAVFNAGVALQKHYGH